MEGWLEPSDDTVTLRYREQNEGFEGDSVEIHFFESEIHMNRRGNAHTDLRFLPGEPQTGKYLVEGFELNMEVQTRKLDWLYDAVSEKLQASLSYELCWENGEAVKTRLEISVTRVK